MGAMIEPSWLREFEHPPASCGQMMFWIWNGEVTEGRITEMLEQYAARGIGGVLIHPRAGLITEYLSERWWKLWDHSLKECVRLGLECHIYDEDAFPSGTAGGLVLEAVPEAGARVLTARLCAGPPVEVGGELLAAFRYTPDAVPLEPLATSSDLGVAAAAGTVLTFVLGPRAAGARGYPDLSLPQATQAFLKLTHDEYAKRFGEHFGKDIKYAFTDEPGLECRDGLAVSRYLLEEFEREHGYDLLDRIYAFAVECEESPSVRFDYFSTINRLWLAGFARAIYDWCADHGLAFTGHYNEHEWPSPSSVPDAMAGQRWMQVPGIDLLGFQFNPDDRLSNALYLLTMKEVASVANQVGVGRVFCEAYGGGGYEMAIPQFKPLSDWLLACGINVINPHLSFETIAGARKYDWPQTLSDHSSWWPCYRVQAEHDARMTVAVTQGRERNRVLLLHPTLTAWMHYVPKSFRLTDDTGGRPGFLEELRRTQCEIVQALADAQIDFDLGDELIMAEMGHVEGGELRIGEGTYTAVVLPENMETWLESTLELVQAFLQAGGTVLALGRPPARLRGRKSDRPAALARAFPQRWMQCERTADLLSRLSALVPPRVAQPDGSPLPPEVTYYRRETADGRRVHLFVNPWKGEVRTRVRMEGRSLLRLDSMTGRAEMAPTDAYGDGQVVDLHLPPAGHALFVGDPERQEVARPPARRLTPAAVTGLTAQRLEPNLLVLDYCDVAMTGVRQNDGRTPDAREQGVNTTRANRLVWQAMGYGRDPWHDVQFRRMLIDRAFPAETRLEVAYRFRIEPDAFGSVRESLTLAVERPWLYAIDLNGRKVSFAPDSRWWDEEIRRTSIAASAQAGENMLRMTAQPFHILCEVAPVYVSGEFGLRRASRGFVIVAPAALTLGDWLDQGLLFYPWGVRYRASFRLSRSAGGLQVRLPEWRGSAARVIVDGQDAGVIAYPPYELGAEGAWGAGEHEMVVDVMGNMKNALGPPFCDGLPGIWSWDIHPERTPDGGAYRFFSCGLMAPPEVSTW